MTGRRFLRNRVSAMHISCLLFTLVFVALPVHAGLFGTSLKYSLVRAPEKVLAGVESVAIQDFQGAGGSALAAELIIELFKENRGDTSSGFFASKDQPFLEEGLTTKVFNKVVRGSSGADALISGTMETVGPDDSQYTAKKIIYNAKMEKVGEKEVRCVKRKAALTARMTVTKAEDGSILHSDSATGDWEDSRCEGDSKTLLSGSDIFNRIAKTLAPKLADKIIPHCAVAKISLQKDKRTKKINKLVKKRQYDEAGSMYKTVLKGDDYNYAANFNIGVLNEAFGNYDEALKYYRKAEAIKSNKDNTRAMERVEKRQDEVERLKGYGMSVAPHVFGQGSGRLVKQVTKGKNKDRWEVYEKPENGSAVTFRIPGGMAVSLTGVEGGFLKIKTFDDREGWILKENVKTAK